MNEKKNCAIVFGLTSNLTFALANVLLGMKKHCSKFWDDIIVFHDNIGYKEQNAINSILNCEFIQYDENLINVKITDNRLKTYSILTLSRFECFNLLKKYNKVIWHDVDILVQKDFIGLLDYAEQSGFALTCDPTFMVEQNFNGILSGYTMLKPLYNAGIMVLSDKLKNYDILSDYCYNKFNEYNEKLRYMDQSVLNMMIQDYDIDVEKIELNKYCCHPDKLESKYAVIVHSYGTNKFWNSEDLKNRFPEWDKNDKLWKDLYKKDSYYSIKDNKNPIVSVIMSVYDRIEYVDDAITSILNQSFSDFEFIIIIEYSENQKNIYEYLKKYKDSRISLILNKEKLGFSASLNIGLDIAKGIYIARMDDDDISLPERFEKQIMFMDSNKDISVVGTFMRMFMNSTQLCEMPISNEELYVRSLSESPMYHPTVMIRRDILEKYGIRYSTDFFTEDYELWSRMLNMGLKFANIPEILHLFRASGNNATVKKQYQVLNSHIEVMKINFKKNLNLDFNFDQLMLLRNADIVNRCFNSEDFIDLRDKTIEKIIIKNEKLNVYNKEILKKYFNYTVEINFKTKVKYRLRSYPILFNFAEKTYKKINRLKSKNKSFLKRKPTGENKMSIFNKIKMRLLPPSSRSFHNKVNDIEGRLNNVEIKLNYIDEKNSLILENIKTLENRLVNIIEDKNKCIEYKIKDINKNIFDINKNNFRDTINILMKELSKIKNSIEALNQDEQYNNISKEIHNMYDKLHEINIESLNNKLQSFSEKQERTFNNVFNKMTESERWIVKEIRGNAFNILFKIDNDLLDKESDISNYSNIYNKWFYLNNRYGSFISGFHFLKNIIPTFKIKSIVDFGCGTGTWLAAAKSISNVEVLGIDGEYVNKKDLMINESEFLSSDLTKGIKLDKKFDLAISVEVAEHLPMSSSERLVKDLCEASDIVLFSAAHEGQGGDGHINCQPFEFWKEKFLKNDFHYINIKEQFKNNWEIEGWYRENISLFISSDRLVEFDAASSFFRGTVGDLK